MSEQDVIPPIIAVDFDGTITMGDTFPNIGKINPLAKWCLNELADAGFCIIIFTCREGALIEQVERFLRSEGVRYMHINQNCRVRVEYYGCDCSKIGATVYIDDRCVSYISKGIDWYYVYETVMVNYGNWASLWKGRECRHCEGSGKSDPSRQDICGSCRDGVKNMGYAEIEQ